MDTTPLDGIMYTSDMDDILSGESVSNDSNSSDSCSSSGTCLSCEENENIKFWTDDHLVLFSDYQLLPSKKQTLNENLNALTRLIIIITGIMYLSEYKYWLYFLIFSLFIVLLIKLMKTNKCKNRNDNRQQERFSNTSGNSNTTPLKEGFSIPPTYVEGAEPMTTIPPLFAEEWQSPPPIYDEYTLAPRNSACQLQQPYNDERPIYGQYITANNLFPYNSAQVNQTSLGEARLYMNDEFTRDSLQFRNDMTRMYVNKLDRWYKNGCSQSISSFNN